jgi:hypothetical protein
MAIELTPKKPKEKPFTFFDFFFYFSFILVLITLAIFGIFFLVEKNLKRNLEEVKKEIIAKETSERKEKEAKVLLIQKQINDFFFLFDSQRFNSRFFDSFQKVVHPKVHFSKIDLRIGEDIVSLSGATENPITLAQQIMAFKQADFLREINLKKVSLSKEGKYDFEIEIFLKPEKFKL